MHTRKIVALTVGISVLLGILLYSKVSVYYRRDHEGIYLLKGFGNDWLAITDDLYPFEAPHLIWGRVLPGLKKVKSLAHDACVQRDEPCLHYEWNEDTGRGFIKTTYPDGKKLIVALGRYVSSNGRDVSGLFVGGGLPTGDPDYRARDNNQTGMAYSDGSRYYHIWCNVNEGIVSAGGVARLPSQWEFNGSQVLESSPHNLTVLSQHRTTIDNIPLLIRRTMFYFTGDTYVTLVTEVLNVGEFPVRFSYHYGDEPWLGNYQRQSRGNIGWYRGGFVLTETHIDTSATDFIGMFDYGNPLIGEPNDFTGKANFLAWDQESRPDMAYFSNKFDSVAPPEAQVPLASDNMRVMELVWGPKELQPGTSFNFVLRVGMAVNDKKSGMPAMPEIRRR